MPRIARPLRIALIALTASLGVLVPAGMASAANWSTPADLSGNASNIGPSGTAVTVGSNAAGDVTAAWIEYTSPDYKVQVAVRKAGGSFSTQTLKSSTNGLYDVTLAENAGGDAVVAWQENAAVSEVWASTRSGDGAFSAPAPLASVPGSQALDPSTGISSNGAAMVVYRLAVNSPYSETVYGVFKPAGGSFGSPQAISSTDPWNQSPRVALDSTGKATIVWSYWTGCAGGCTATDNIARVRIRNANGTLGTQRNLSPGAPTGYPMFATVAVDSAGGAVAVWSWYNGSVYEVQGATRLAASDTWTTLPKFGESASASYGSEPVIGADTQGNTVAIWRAANNTINAASRNAGGAFGTAQLGISAPTADTPRIALDGSGTATAVWSRYDGSTYYIESAVRPLGGTFGGVRTISSAPNSTRPAVSVDGTGDVFAAWKLDDTSMSAPRQRVQFSVLDQTPPSLSGVNVPGTATVGDNVGMSAESGDKWSGTTVAWDFGDGTGATGSSVSHTFGTAGTYAINIKATDGAGNSTTATRTIQVGAKPVPPPPPATPRVTSGITFSFRWTKKYTKVSFINLASVPKGGKIRLTCKGKGCPFKVKKRTFKSGAKKAALAKYFKKKKKGSKKRKNAKLRKKTRITLYITAPGHIGKVGTWKTRKNKIPKFTTGCLALNTATKKISCP